MPRSDETTARLQLLAAAALFSTGGAAIKACSLSGLQVAGFRSGVAALAIFALLPAARRHWTWRTITVGTTYAATLILFVTANKLTTAANTIFLQSTAPLYMLVIGPLVLREPLRRRDLPFLAIMAAGLTMFFVGFEDSSTKASNPPLGNILAVLSGISWASTVSGMRWIAREAKAGAETTMASVLAGNAIAFLVCTPWSLPLGATASADWGLILYLGVFQITLPYVLLAAGVRKLTALEAILLLLVEPVLNPIWAWLAHGERPGPWALAGGALILAATVGKSWLDRPRIAAPTAPLPPPPERPDGG